MVPDCTFDFHVLNAWLLNLIGKTAEQRPRMKHQNLFLGINKNQIRPKRALCQVAVRFMSHPYLHVRR